MKALVLAVNSYVAKDGVEVSYVLVPAEKKGESCLARAYVRDLSAFNLGQTVDVVYSPARGRFYAFPLDGSCG